MADGDAEHSLIHVADHLQVGLHTDLPRPLVRELRLVFPDRVVRSVVTVAQKASVELVKWDEEVDREKDRLLEQVRCALHLRGAQGGAAHLFLSAPPHCPSPVVARLLFSLRSLWPLPLPSVTFSRPTACGPTSSTPAPVCLCVARGWARVRPSGGGLGV